MNDSRLGRGALTVPEDPTRVTVADLKSIEAISALLLSFGDARAGADVLARHVLKIRVLEARIGKRFAARYPNRMRPEVAQQLALLGNRELEAILLELLEDVVTLASEMGDRKQP
jgi:hypothetical protein